ncbi:MAG: 3-isopropylmalate dehydratase small subunit [Alphaproteobacteria bacterium]|nr:3-isopropylmalate dehydratase small subunit [Alphaproteobacteria bacterium]
MQAFTTLRGVAAPLDMVNVDTDMIIPKQFLKTIERTGLGRGLFYELRTDAKGNKKGDFVLDRPAYRAAKILVAGRNFGCGSSREHAPWALLDAGIRCVIASSFADIFFNNCFKNGILPVILPEETVKAMLKDAENGANAVFSVDLAAQTVTRPDGQTVSFDIDPARKQHLLKGLDDIGLTLEKKRSIDDYEKRQRQEQPWLATR